MVLTVFKLERESKRKENNGRMEYTYVYTCTYKIDQISPIIHTHNDYICMHNYIDIMTSHLPFLVATLIGM